SGVRRERDPSSAFLYRSAACVNALAAFSSGEKLIDGGTPSTTGVRNPRRGSAIDVYTPSSICRFSSLVVVCFSLSCACNSATYVCTVSARLVNWKGSTSASAQPTP